MCRADVTAPTNDRNLLHKRHQLVPDYPLLIGGPEQQQKQSRLFACKPICDFKPVAMTRVLKLTQTKHSFKIVLIQKKLPMDLAATTIAHL